MSKRSAHVMWSVSGGELAPTRCCDASTDHTSIIAEYLRNVWESAPKSNNLKHRTPFKIVSTIDEHTA
jgi:hypothetical protein